MEINYKGAILQIEEHETYNDPDSCHIVIEIRFILSRMPNCTLHYAPPEVNKIANWLAKYTSSTSICNLWVDSWPNEFRYFGL